MANGGTFNGTASSSLNIEHFVPLIPLLPERKPTVKEIPGRDGKVDFRNDSYRPRLIPVDVLTDAASSESELDGWLQDIAVWLSGEGNLYFDDDTTKQWTNAKVYSSVEMEHPPLRRKWTVTFECDPYAEDVTETESAAVDTETDYGSDVEFYPDINIALYDLVNQCTNGDFPADATGWTDLGADLSVVSEECNVTGDGSSAIVYLIQADAADLDVSHKYYTRCTARVTNTDCQALGILYDGSTAGTEAIVDTQTTPVNGTSYTLSALDAPPADATGTFQIAIAAQYAAAGTASGKVMIVDNVFVIDCTSIFGAGNEPDLATMDGYVSDYLTAQSVTHFTDTPATYVQATLSSTGEYVRVEDTFANGDDIVMTMSTGKVTKNDSTCMDKVTLTSLFFGVPTGDQTVNITSDGFYIANMGYYKRYLYA